MSQHRFYEKKIHISNIELFGGTRKPIGKNVAIDYMKQDVTKFQQQSHSFDQRRHHLNYT